MSERRRRNRIQGGWSKPASRERGCTDDRQAGFEETEQKTPHGQTLGNQPLVYEDPRQSKMASRKPYNFSWVIPGLLAGSGLPRNPAEVQYFLDEKIDILVSLTEWKPSLHLAPGLQHVHMPVAEFEPPSVKQAVDFVTLVENARDASQKVAVHCHWGRGRTGTMIACFLLKSQCLKVEESIEKTRQARPYSVETYEQERLVHKYYKILHQDKQ